MKHKKWFWGIFFLLAAVFVIACQTGSFLHIGFLSILATILLAGLLIQSIADRSFFGAFLSAALLYLIYQKPLGFPVLSFWILLLAAVLASIGCHILFRNHWNIHSGCRCSDIFEAGSSENLDGNHVYARTRFGESSKYLHSQNLQKGDFEVSFGEMQLYFDQAQISPEGAEIQLSCSFGAMKLYIPRQWHVVNRLKAGFGAVDAGSSAFSPDGSAPTLTVTGNASFGSIEIHPV